MANNNTDDQAAVATACVDDDPTSWDNLLMKTINSIIKNNKYLPFDNNNKELIKNILANIPELDENVKYLLSINYNNKNINISTKHRKKGNDYFLLSKNEYLNNAIEEYTKSIAFASKNNNELSLGYANRSAALLKAKLYQHCLNDIESAFNNNYPINLKAKLYARKSICLKLSNPRDDYQAKLSNQEAKKLLNKMDEKNKIFTMKLLNEYKTINKSINPEFGLWATVKCLPIIKIKNEQLSELSNCVKLNYNNKFGWHIIATRNIKPSDVIFIQKPYVKIVIDSMNYKICSYCLKQSWSSIPCDDCSDVIYCSSICQENGQIEYHHYECNIIGPMKKFHMKNYFFMALRLAIKALDDDDGSFESLKNNIIDLNNQQDNTSDKYKTDTIDPTEFSTIYNLNINENILEDNKAELLKGSIIIAYLLVTKTVFIGKKLTGSIENLIDNNDFIFMIEFIEKLALISMTNIFTIDMLIDSAGDDDDDDKRIDIFHCISVCQSLFNHSCNPTIFCRYHDNRVVGHSLQVVKKDEQVFICYGPHYRKSTRIERQIKLNENYKFKCRCDACHNNWSVKPIKTPISSFSCKHEREEIARGLKNFNDDMEMRNGFVTAMSKNGIPTVIQHRKNEEMPEAVEVFSKRFGNNSIEVYKCIEILKKIFSFGDRPFYVIK